MKGFTSSSESFIKNPLLIKISTLIFIAIVFFYFGTQFSDSTQQLIFFNSKQNPNSPTSSIALSPNFKKIPALKTLIPVDPPPPLPSQPPPPPPMVLERLGVVDENGTMSEDFEIGGGFDPNLVENFGNGKDEVKGEVHKEIPRVKVGKFEVCSESMREYIPCLDNVEEIKKLNSTEKGEKFERHCPVEGKGLNCLVPPPKGSNSLA